MSVNFKNKINYSGLIFFLAFFSLQLFANNKPVHQAIKSIELLVDSSQSFSFKEIENSSGFSAIKNGYTYPNTTFNYWFRIKIQTQELQQKKYFLTINSGFHFDLTCYYINNSIVVQKAGFINKNNTGHSHSNPAFEIALPDTNQFYVYIQAKSYGCTENFYFDLAEEQNFHEGQEKMQFTFGFFYGILLVIMLVNIFYFFSLKRKAFLYYSIYVSLTMLVCSYFDGIPLMGLLNTIGKHHQFVVFADILIYVAFMPLMAIHYVQLEKIKPKLLKTANWYFIFTLISIVAALYFSSNEAYAAYFLYHNLTILFGIVLTVIIGIKGLKHNKILGRSFILSFSIIVLVLIISTLEDYGVTSFKLYYDLVKLGSLLEVIILSLALALYFRDLDRTLTKKNKELNLLAVDFEQAQEQFSHLEGRFLRSQMNPHFIFNAMSSIQNFILSNENKMAHEYLSKFAKLIRNVLEFSRKDFIYLQEEIETLSIYIQLEKLRASDKFNYTIKTAEGINSKTCLVPSMIIQPFIENAIVHGLFPKDANDDGLLSVYFEQHGQQLICTIEDNGIGREKSKEIRDKKEKYHQSRGMSVTKDRLEILKNINHLDAGYTFEDLYDTNKNARGTRVVIVLPINTTIQ